MLIASLQAALQLVVLSPTVPASRDFPAEAAVTGHPSLRAEQTRLAARYDAGRRLAGGSAARHLLGKLFTPSSTTGYGLLFSGFHFHDSENVIVASAQALLTENAVYRVNGNDVCITQSSINGLGCFNISVVDENTAVFALIHNERTIYIEVRRRL